MKSVEEAMTNAINLVLLIDESLPDQHKLLNWLPNFETPDFSTWEEISIINFSSNLSQLPTF